MPVDSPIRRVNPQAFETPRQLNPALSPATEAIVLKAMGEDPQDCYQSALEMAQAIVASGVVHPNSPGLPTSGPLLGFPTSQPLPAYPTTTWPGQAPGQPQGPTPPYPGQAQGPHHLSAPPPVPTFPVPSPAGRRGQASVAAPSPICAGQESCCAGACSRATPCITAWSAGWRRCLRGCCGARWSRLSLLYEKYPTAVTSSTPTGTIPITLTYSTEKSDWMNASVAAFHKSNIQLGGKAIQVTLDPRGSVDDLHAQK